MKSVYIQNQKNGSTGGAVFCLAFVMTFFITAPAWAGFPSFFEAVKSEASLVSYWTLTEPVGTTGSGSVKDSDGSNDGTPSGVILGDAGGLSAFPGLYGSPGAASFDGSDDKITVPDNATLDITAAITLEAVVKVTGLPPSGGGRIATNTKYAMLILPSGKVQFFLSGTSSAVSDTPSALSLDVWHHLVGTYDKDAGADNLNFYVDGGEPVITKTVTGAIDISALDFVLGCVPGACGSTLALTGLIDEFAIYNSALSKADVQLHYEALFNPEPATMAIFGFGLAGLLFKRKSLFVQK